MQKIALGALATIFLAACGGGGGTPPDVSDPPDPAGVQSPGGIWFGFDSRGEQGSLYIAETGTLRAVLNPDGGTFPSFGGGSVSVTSNDVISGSFELQGVRSLPPISQGEDLGCSISGTVQERQALSVNIVCSDSGGLVYDESFTMIYDINSYERPSSLEAIAGNYTLDFQPDMNSINILADGTISGMLNTGARCMVNGTAAMIDPNFTLIDITWTMSACTDIFGIYEGVQMSGFALANLAPVGNPGIYYFLLTGQTQNGIYVISLLYEPV